MIERTNVRTFSLLYPAAGIEAANVFSKYSYKDFSKWIYLINLAKAKLLITES